MHKYNTVVRGLDGARCIVNNDFLAAWRSSFLLTDCVTYIPTTNKKDTVQASSGLMPAGTHSSPSRILLFLLHYLETYSHFLFADAILSVRGCKSVINLMKF